MCLSVRWLVFLFLAARGWVDYFFFGLGTLFTSSLYLWWMWPFMDGSTVPEGWESQATSPYYTIRDTWTNNIVIQRFWRNRCIVRQSDTIHHKICLTMNTNWLWKGAGFQSLFMVQTEFFCYLFSIKIQKKFLKPEWFLYRQWIVSRIARRRALIYLRVIGSLCGRALWCCVSPLSPLLPPLLGLHQDEDFGTREDIEDSDQLRIGNDGIFMLTFFSKSLNASLFNYSVFVHLKHRHSLKGLNRTYINDTPLTFAHQEGKKKVP